MLAFTNTTYTKMQAVGNALQHYYGKRSFHWGTYKAVEDGYGIPENLWYIHEQIAASLEPDQARQWLAAFFSAIPERDNMQRVVDQMYYWLLTDPAGIRPHAEGSFLLALNGLTACYKKRLENGYKSLDDWFAETLEIDHEYITLTECSTAKEEQLANLLLSSYIQQHGAFELAADIVGKFYWQNISAALLGFLGNANAVRSN